MNVDPYDTDVGELGALPVGLPAPAAYVIVKVIPVHCAYKVKFAVWPCV